MGLRNLAWLLLLQALCLLSASAAETRHRRQAAQSFPGPPPAPKAYQPPIALSAPPPAPVASNVHNSYQPPISLIRSNEYQPVLAPVHNPYPAGSGRSIQSQPGPQSYVLSNQASQHQPESVQYVPPASHGQSFTAFQQSAPRTSYSVQQQPPARPNQPYAILSDSSGLPQSTVERSYSTHTKVVGSAHVPVQAISKTPASEVEPEKSSAAKEKDKANDEYVIYYYYYYDNDTSPNSNLTLNFDDIPSLESYDGDKAGKEQARSASASSRNLANANTVPSTHADKSDKKDSPPADASSALTQPRAVGAVYARPDRPGSPENTAVVEPLKPVSNVFRYGGNEVPRFPILPNFVVTEEPTTTRPEAFTLDALSSESPSTMPARLGGGPGLKHVDEDDELNKVLDNGSNHKPIDEKSVEEDPTTTTTTTEAPTTTEEPTTTTEGSRRRPSFGGRRRPSGSFQPNRGRQPPSSRSTPSTSSTSTTTTTSSPGRTRSSFQSNRYRPRRPPASGGARPRPGSRVTSSDDEPAPEAATTASTTSTSTSTTAPSRSQSRYSTPRATQPRRFQSSRSRSQASSTSTSSTTSTTSRPSVPSRSRAAVTGRPRPSFSRNARPRPSFLRPRPGSEPAEPEPTTTPEPAEETSPEAAAVDDAPSTSNEDGDEEHEEEEESSEEEAETPTTTEASRFSALFRPRNRNALGNRPRPVIANRPSRS